MIAEITLNNRKIEVDLDNPLDISIPMIFNGPQPSSYNVKAASSKPYEVGNFIGDTRLGGSCNFEELNLISHCNGTHTECVGHISDERISIHNTLKSSFFPAMVITVQPVSPKQTHESYDPELNSEDMLITSAAVTEAVNRFDKIFSIALMIRTIPNDDSKLSRKYMDKQAPFFTLEAAKAISEMGVEHLLVDMPSVDRAFDEGKLRVHHVFWSVENGSHDVNKQNHSLKTITEMIYVHESIPDGEYLLNLQIAPFVSDASPSRPLIFNIQK